MYSGRNGRYFWLTNDNVATTLDHALNLCPSLVEDQFVVISALDSDPLTLTEAELAAGWQQHGELACSPRIANAKLVPQGEFDEWYVFSEQCVPVIPEIFVNYCPFELRDPTELEPESDSTVFRLHQMRFWQQISHIAPVSYIGYGGQLAIVTTNEHIINTLLAGLT